MAIRKIDTGNLEVGMYVSELDRSWTETPFFFQGFEIEGNDDIERLNMVCKHVFIIVPDEEIQLHGALDRSCSDSPQLPLNDGGVEIQLSDELELHRNSAPLLPVDHAAADYWRYEATSSFDEELPAARESHETLSDLVVEMARDVRHRDVIDIPVLKKSVHVMTESVIRNPDPILWLMRLKKYDSYTYRHMINVSVWAAALGRQYGLSESKIHRIALGGICLDIGVLKLPRGLLEKKEPLNQAEQKLFREHVGLGVKILSESGSIHQDVLEIVQTHHERHNGTGYPCRLQSTQIPLLGRIVGIVDEYVSITSPRAANPLSSAEALQSLFRQSDKRFDTKLVDTLIQLVGVYPTGSLVEMSTGEIAIVMSQSPKLRLRPKVVVLLDPDKKPYGSFPVFNLMSETHDKNGKPLTILRGISDGDYGIKYSDITI